MDIIIKTKSISDDFALNLTYDLENFGIELIFKLFAHPIFCFNEEEEMEQMENNWNIKQICYEHHNSPKNLVQGLS